MKYIYIYNLMLLLLLYSYKTAFGGNLIANIESINSIELEVSPPSVYNDFRAAMPSVVHMSPNAAALTMYADYPVSHYTGIPNISIPLYEINIGDYILPISLNYHASGVKISQEASNVGLGWSLNAGGVISRSIKGMDDFKKVDGCYYNPVMENPIWTDYYSTGDILLGDIIKDTEPDIFFYSFPGGSGKFIINETDGALLFNNDPNIKIETFPYDSSQSGVPIGSMYFVITTPNGIKYEFKQYELNQSKSARTWVNKNSPSGSPVVRHAADWHTSSNFISAWFLTKVITPKNRVIEFLYNSMEEYISPQYESCSKYTNISTPVGNGNLNFSINGITFYSVSQSITTSWALSEIVWNGGAIKLSTSPRNDFEKRIAAQVEKIDIISIFNKKNELLKKYNLTYDYFNSNSNGEYEHIYKRLKLTGVAEWDDSGEVIGKYDMLYYEGIFPAKNSNDKDYWGYNNGKQYGENYYCAGRGYSGLQYQGAIKTANLDYALIGTLKGIKYPTGGTVNFKYELNAFEGTNWNNEYSYTEKIVNIETFTTSPGNNNPMYEITEEDSQTFVLKYNTDIAISGSLHHFIQHDPNHVNNPNWRYNDEKYYPQTILKRIAPDTQVICQFGTPYLTSGSPPMYHYMDRTFSQLPPGTYIFEAISPIYNVLSTWQLRYIEPLESTNGTHIVEGGGLRVSEISNSAKVRKFNYSTGKHLIAPTYTYVQNISGRNYNSTGYALYDVQTSESTISMASFSNGNFIGYDWVEESIGSGSGISKTKFIFMNDYEDTVQNPSHLTDGIVPFAPVFYEALMEGFPYKPVDIQYHNGLIKEIINYNGDKVVQKTVYEYQTFNSSPNYGFVCETDRLISKSQTYDIYLANRLPYFYTNVAKWLFKSKETTINYTEGNANVTNTKEFEYNPYYQLKSMKYCNNNNVHKEEFSYPTDFDDQITGQMNAKYMIGIPIETTGWKNNEIFVGKKTLYKDTLNMILPGVIYILETTGGLAKEVYNSKYRPEIFIDQYDLYGNIIQARKGGVLFTYIWSYNGQYPIAVINGASYEDVKRALNETDSYFVTLASKIAPDFADEIKINQLRSQLNNAFVNTYTYKSLYGLSSVVDQSGKTTYYGYDSIGRLKVVYRMNGSMKEVLESYEYSYINR